MRLLVNYISTFYLKVFKMPVIEGFSIKIHLRSSENQHQKRFLVALGCAAAVESFHWQMKIAKSQEIAFLERVSCRRSAFQKWNGGVRKNAAVSFCVGGIGTGTRCIFTGTEKGTPYHFFRPPW